MSVTALCVGSRTEILRKWERSGRWGRSPIFHKRPASWGLSVQIRHSELRGSRYDNYFAGRFLCPRIHLHRAARLLTALRHDLRRRRVDRILGQDSRRACSPTLSGWRQFGAILP